MAYASQLLEFREGTGHFPSMLIYQRLYTADWVSMTFDLNLQADIGCRSKGDMFVVKSWEGTDRILIELIDQRQQTADWVSSGADDYAPVFLRHHRHMQACQSMLPKSPGHLHLTVLGMHLGACAAVHLSGYNST